jgi:quercetin dioxygenase-like cupin family protein
MTNSTVEAIHVGGMTIRFLVEGDDTAGGAAVFEFDVPAGGRIAAAHSHDGYEETIVGLEGAMTWTVEGDEKDVGPGEALVIPRGAVHRFANVGPVAARSLAIVTPGLLGPEYFLEVAAVLELAGDGPPDPAAIAAVMRRHGLTPHP